MTTAAGRTSLLGQLEQAIATQERVGLLLLNIRQFRRFNAAFGHRHGDELLHALEERIRGALRESDRLYRIAADEFAVVLRGLRSPQHIVLAAARLTDLCSSKFCIAGRELRVRLHIAGATFPEHAENLEHLLQCADLAMGQAKAAGAGFQLFEPEQGQQGRDHMEMERALEEALETAQFELHFQPKIDLGTGRACGGEALARWRHPEWGEVSPASFIPVLERSDLVIPFTEWTLNSALQQCAECRRSYNCLSVAVNLSARSLYHPELSELVLRAMRIWDTDPGALVLEVTESAMMQHPERSLATLRELDAMGVRISIDDFGTGYSSLAYLQNLPVRELKIDRSFVADLNRAPQNERIVRSIVDLGHNFGLVVVAEGVEDLATLDRLRALDCDQAQGYLMGRPMPGTEMKEWLAKSEWGLGPAVPRAAGQSNG